MSNLNISAAMTAAVEPVLAASSVTEFTVDITVNSTDDATYSYTPLWIDSITISQDFADTFADRLTLEYTAAPDDYIQMFNNSKGLMVALRIVYVNSQTQQRVFTPPPIARMYKAMLMDPQDLLKKYTTGSLMPSASMPLVEQHLSTRIPVKLALIEAAAYTLRQQQFHCIYQQATIASVIAHIIQSFSITQLYLVPPDNTMTWTHIIIPPAQNISEIFDYIHTTYGIYMKGIEWYYTNGILYLYPGYENNPSIKYTADIYNVPEGNYAGLLSYHQLNTASNNIGIVSTTKVNTTDISRPAAENTASNYSFVRASSIIDNFTTTTATGTFIKNNNALTVGTPVNRTMSDHASNPRYTEATDNIFLESSKLAKMNAVLIECGWNNAIPFALYPGHNVKYHYDQDGTFTYQQGMLERVVYHFDRKRKNAVGNVYAGTAQINLRANSDVTSAVQTLSI